MLQDEIGNVPFVCQDCEALYKCFTNAYQALIVFFTRYLGVDDEGRATMKTIEVEDDVYHYIAAQTKEIGEPATSILRRLLNVQQGMPASKVVVATTAHELALLLSQSMFSSSTTAVARMLRIFKEAHSQKQQEFEKVLSIHGRNRAYFAKSEQEILKSGKSTQPREIEGTGFWVMTNSPTQQKQQMVREVLEVLGYSQAATNAAVSVIQ
jgi:negative modulator of initiation of replication